MVTMLFPGKKFRISHQVRATFCFRSLFSRVKDPTDFLNRFTLAGSKLISFMAKAMDGEDSLGT
jgi:hypothetical protein